jgi:hypothetical protein
MCISGVIEQIANESAQSSFERSLKGAFIGRQSIESVVEPAQLSAYTQQLVECIQLATVENQEAERRSNQVCMGSIGILHAQIQITDSDSASDSDTDTSETDRDCCKDHHDKFVSYDIYQLTYLK